MLDKKNNEADQVGTQDSETDHLKVGLPQDVDYEGYIDPASKPGSNTSS